MAGHSQFKNIMHRKGAKDAKRAKLFTKITREIISAAKTGLPDPVSNPRLRAAIQWAREENMPRDRIDAAIARATSAGQGDQYEAIRYEAYGPGGVAMMIESLTDNRNRTASDVRAAFSKFGGNLGESGSVSFQFQRVGVLQFPAKVASAEAMFEASILAEADQCDSDDQTHTIRCSMTQFPATREALEASFGAATTAQLQWESLTPQLLNQEDTARSLFKLIDALEDLDDVQQVITNVELPDALAQLLAQSE